MEIIFTLDLGSVFSAAVSLVSLIVALRKNKSKDE
jgi:hypothetical protein